MKCAKLHLQERSRARPKSEPRYDKPRRYCQKLLVDPQFENNNRWIDEAQKFDCSDYQKDNVNGTINSRRHPNTNDMVLTVQTLKFNGKSQQNKRPRTSFKYKTINGQKHRMFVKQVVDENVGHYDGDRASELTCYYFNDYANYFINNDRSRSSSAKSSILKNVDNSLKQNKSVQVDFKNFEKIEHDKKSLPLEEKYNKKCEIKKNEASKLEEISNIKENDAKIIYQKHGKRKSITISKTESPETVQVIRVDLICNYNCGSTNSNNEEHTRQNNGTQVHAMENKKDDENLRKKSYDKYLLTKSIKALDENISGGTKVTLLCKTFRLADRSKFSTGKRQNKQIFSDCSC